MTRASPGNPDSIRARLLNRARAEGVEFQQVLTRFALERLLYRLSISDHRDQFLLKGALLFNLWYSELHRPTRDVDFLGFGPDDLPRIEAVFRDLCDILVPDGITFDPKSVKAAEIRLDANYGGVRVTLMGLLAGARCPIQADVGFGDAVTPSPEEASYPTLLADLPAPNLRVYPKYTVIAEKFHAIVELGMENSRMKDYFDLWILLGDPTIDRPLAAKAIQATFDRRQTQQPTGIPLGLSKEFALDALKTSQWNAFVTRSKLKVPDFAALVDELRRMVDGLF
jgi:predicted nucleotidyltransferase component of viral defense system